MGSGEAILVVKGGPDDWEIIRLPHAVVSIGRLPLNEIVVNEVGVSRQHAAIKGTPAGYYIQDLGSHNSTFINGEQLGVQPRLLLSLDRIEIGGTRELRHFVFMLSDGDRAPPPAAFLASHPRRRPRLENSTGLP